MLFGWKTRKAYCDFMGCIRRFIASRARSHGRHYRKLFASRARPYIKIAADLFASRARSYTKHWRRFVREQSSLLRWALSQSVSRVELAPTPDFFKWYLENNRQRSPVTQSPGCTNRPAQCVGRPFLHFEIDEWQGGGYGHELNGLPRNASSMPALYFV